MVSSFSVVSDGEAVIVSMDSTGFSEMCTSQYFIKQKKDFGIGSKLDESREFSKATYAGNVVSKIILAQYSGSVDHNITHMPDAIAHLKDANVEVVSCWQTKGMMRNESTRW